MPAVPDYQRVINLIVEHIRSREWPPHHKLPTAAELAVLIGEPTTSSMTARRATDQLQAAGILVGRQGKGVYVAADPYPALAAYTEGGDASAD